MSPLRKPLFITKGCKIQYLRHQEKAPRLKSFPGIMLRDNNRTQVYRKDPRFG